MSDVTLFGLERSVYTRIARLALEEKGVAYRLEDVEIFGADGVPAEHRVRHPFGRIPVLEHGAFRLYETTAITRYVDEAFVGPVLQPEAPAQRARMNQIVSVLDAYAYRPMVWGLFVETTRGEGSGARGDRARIDAALQASQLCLAALGELGAFAPFLVAGEPCLADLHAFPILRYLALVTEGRDLLRAQGSLHRWMQAMLVRPSVQRTCGRYELEAGTLG
jgi:glutathione S-transferase